MTIRMDSRAAETCDYHSEQTSQATLNCCRLLHTTFYELFYAAYPERGYIAFCLGQSLFPRPVSWAQCGASTVGGGGVPNLATEEHAGNTPYFTWLRCESPVFDVFDSDGTLEASLCMQTALFCTSYYYRFQIPKPSVLKDVSTSYPHYSSDADYLHWRWGIWVTVCVQIATIF